ncbi:MAG: FeoB-associated Cys-rich membrane protein [Planctomycetes bacterium]|nr:FeoB-associated Cys-rich membrane protein [Planctomycetota bacterium]
MQDIITISIVALAGGFLLRRAWMRIANRQRGVCGSCSHCNSSDTMKSLPLVTIKQLPSSRDSPLASR